jgi:hypothetical protein
LAFLAAARAHGGGLWWRGEWACTRTYRVRDRWGVERKHTLRPDAELRYAGPGGAFRAFLEIDRDNESAKRLAGKVTRYYAYRADSGDDGFAVFLVTLGLGRGDGSLTAACEIARERRVPVLDLHATTAAELTTYGPWASIWRDVRGRLRPLST